MSELADVRQTIRGRGGTGSVQVYTLAPAQRLRLELVTFTLTTDSTVASRNPQVAYSDQDGNLLAAIPDLNDVTASSTVSYTFGIGLPAFCGVAPDGAYVQNALPDTWLEPQASITIESLDASTGNVISGDTISFVILWGIADTSAAIPDVVPLLTPIALDEQVGDALAGVLGLFG